MSALGATVAAAARLLDGVVYLNEDAHGEQLSKQQLSTSLLGQNRRIKALEAELEAARAASEAARRGQETAEARLKDAARLVASLRAEVSNGKVALREHVAELLRTQEALAALRAGRAQQDG